MSSFYRSLVAQKIGRLIGLKYIHQRDPQRLTLEPAQKSVCSKKVLRTIMSTCSNRRVEFHESNLYKAYYMKTTYQNREFDTRDGNFIQKIVVFAQTLSIDQDAASVSLRIGMKNTKDRY